MRPPHIPDDNTPHLLPPPRLLLPPPASSVGRARGSAVRCGGGQSRQQRPPQLGTRRRRGEDGASSSGAEPGGGGPATTAQTRGALTRRVVGELARSWAAEALQQQLGELRHGARGRRRGQAPAAIAACVAWEDKGKISLERMTSGPCS